MDCGIYAAKIVKFFFKVRDGESMWFHWLSIENPKVRQRLHAEYTREYHLLARDSDIDSMLQFSENATHAHHDGDWLLSGD